MKKGLPLLLALTIIFSLSSCCLSHDYIKTVAEEASCVAEGSINYKCSNCDSEKTESIPALGHDYKYSVVKEPTIDELGTEEGVCIVCGDIQTKELPCLGVKKEAPIVITVDQLVSEIKTNIDKAKNSYNDKWIKISGKVKNIYESAGMVGYYVYGDKGDSGLRIVCWVYDAEYSRSLIGKEVTFVGQMREVTTVNATEIGECDIVNQ